jgi:hypothetical protein
VQWNRRRVGSCGTSRPVIALAAFSWLLPSVCECEDSLHGRRRKISKR